MTLRPRIFAAALLLALAACTAETFSPASADHLAVVQGAEQNVRPGRDLDSAIVVRLTDDQGRPAARVAVQWRITAGGGLLVTHDSLTGPDGTASAYWRMGLSDSTQVLEIRTMEADPVRVELTPVLFHVHSIAVGAAFGCGLDDSAATWCWGENRYGRIGSADPQAMGPYRVTSDSLKFAQLSLGYDHACGLTAGGAVWCWGDNTYGQLGDAPSSGSVATPTPVQVSGLPPLTTLNSQANATCGIDAGGGLWCWGGMPNEFTPIPPTHVFPGQQFQAIALAPIHACAIDLAGVVLCWGSNGSGQLGNGTTGGGAAVPTPIARPLRAVRIVAGDEGSCAVDVNANLYCWGDVAGMSSPEWRANGPGFPALMPDAPVRAISFGWYCGAVWTVGARPRMLCLGESFPGDQDIETTTEPVAEVAMGWRSICLRTTSGTLYCKTYSDLSHPPYFDYTATAIPAP